MRKQIQCKRDDNGCQVVVSHALNADGYARLMFGGVSQKKGHMYMVHRVVYEAVYGVIPEGYEVDHECKNRACVNPNHLKLLPRQEHRSKDNGMRYQHVADQVVAEWQSTGKSGRAIDASLGLVRGRAARIIRQYKIKHGLIELDNNPGVSETPEPIEYTPEEN